MEHNNIINLKEIILTKPSPKNNGLGSTIYVLDYMEHDFAGLKKGNIRFDLS